MRTAHLGLAFGAALSLSAAAMAEITLVGTCAIPGDARDLSGLTNPITDQVPHNLLGSFGSAIDYTGKDDLYIAMNDRGPGDGSLPFWSRFQTFRITIDPKATQAVQATLTATTLLRTESGQALTGIASAIYDGDQSKGGRLDPEGVRLGGRGTIFVADEYGPWVDEFGMDGTRVRRLVVPEKFRIAHPSADPAEEVANNTSGREPNHGFEGLAISPDRTMLWAIVQTPLIQDSEAKDALRPNGSRRGTYCRILEITLATGATRELAYALQKPSHSVCELVAIDGQTLLALERDSAAKKSRGLFRVDLREATDVSAIKSLPVAGAIEGVRPVGKSAWLDFMEARFGLAAQMPEKIEGVTFGPDLADGRRTVIVTSDNDLKPEEPSQIWVFACTTGDLGEAKGAGATGSSPGAAVLAHP